ncbi:hypothetical protein GCM10007036_42840 [Alsobacter metallidurans]|uniref:Glycine zipper domain-containing protein n=1 Tax=Alsobacter metallidurans TaxID=340221 RepID=A0A917IAU1_9HYPH|nr:hypothetical protein [Alsobacter metallidurans]GGH31549.1 hypothetical protein GCM10007036_42840 [Alsobacter metallidurans]
MRNFVLGLAAVTAVVLAQPAFADDSGAAAGVATGAIAGGVAGGPVGAAVGAGVGGVVGGAVTGPNKERVIVEQRGPAVETGTISNCSSKTVQKENSFGDTKTTTTQSCD